MFASEIEAAKAYDEAATINFGPFARDDSGDIARRGCTIGRAGAVLPTGVTIGPKLCDCIFTPDC